MLDVRSHFTQPFDSIFVRIECLDREASVLGAECEEPCLVKLFKWTKNGCLPSRKGFTKVAEFSRQIPEVGCGHCCLRLSKVQDYFVVGQRGRRASDLQKQVLSLFEIEWSFRGRFDEVVRMDDSDIS